MKFTGFLLLLPFAYELRFATIHLIAFWFCLSISLRVTFFLFQLFNSQNNLLASEIFALVPFDLLWFNRVQQKTASVQQIDDFQPKIKRRKMASVFEGLEVGPAIEVFALNKAYNEDKSPVKVNLGVGGMNLLCYFYDLLWFSINKVDKLQTQPNKPISRHIRSRKLKNWRRSHINIGSFIYKKQPCLSINSRCHLKVIPYSLSNNNLFASSFSARCWSYISKLSCMGEINTGV